MSLYADPDATERRLIPVVLEPIDAKTLRPAVARLNRVDLTDPFSRLERYRHLCKFLNISVVPGLPANPPELYISVSSLGKADALALKTIEYALRALADVGPAMKPFGTYQGADPNICLERMPAASAHVLVFPTRPSMAPDEAVARAKAEYEQARRNNVEVLAYVPSRVPYDIWSTPARLSRVRIRTPNGG